MMVVRTRMWETGTERWGHTPDTFGRWSLEDLLIGWVWAVREEDSVSGM